MCSVILSTSYFPPLGYFKNFNNHNNIYIENSEYYKRHSIRNRASILGVNGTILLTVPVERKHYSKTLIKNIKIANNKWKKTHLNSIKSAYGSSPFFIYYFEDIKDIINTNHVFLIDLNNEILNYFLNEMKIRIKIKKTEKYIKDYPMDVLDFRDRNKENNRIYQQVFSENFIPNLSILDLIFNAGPNAREYI